MRYAAFDQYQRLAPREYEPVPVRIIDIDEQSLREFGQWPWPRSLVAELLGRLQDLGAAAVAFDTLFAEPDRLSPKLVLKDVPGVDAALLAKLPDNDEIFARQIAARPTVLGLAAVRDGVKLPAPKAGFAYLGESPLQAPPPVSGAVVPLPAFAEAAQGIGDISMSTDQDDAVVRIIPLFLSDGAQLVPTLTLEALRVAQGASTYIVENAPDAPASIGAVKVGDFEIPTTRSGGFWLYLTPERQERYVSASAVLKGNADIAPLIDGNIVFIGTSAAGLLDIRGTPLGQNVPGVSLHAQALEQILLGHYLYRPDWADGFEITIVAAVGLLVAAMIAIFSPSIAVMAGMAVAAAFLAFSWHAFRAWGFLIDPVAPILASITAQFATVGFRLLVTDRERRHIRRAFGNYVSPAVLARAENQPNGLRLGGDDREITMMFMDVREFTTISESLTPTALVAFLNKLLTGLSRHVIESDGTLDKFIGDSIMAFWNAPVDVEEHPARAARCALKMRETLREMNKTGSLGLDRQVAIGIGINTGIACVGEIGAEDRFNYSAVGDSVNTTARIESMCKDFGFDILVSGATAERLKEFAILEAGSRSLKGKTKQTELFLLIGDETVATSAEFRALRAGP